MRKRGKVVDSNTLKSNLSNPHYRCSVTGNITKLYFADRYGRNFLPNERRGNDVVSPHFEDESRFVEPPNGSIFS